VCGTDLVWARRHGGWTRAVGSGMDLADGDRGVLVSGTVNLIVGLVGDHPAEPRLRPSGPEVMGPGGIPLNIACQDRGPQGERRPGLGRGALWPPTFWSDSEAGGRRIDYGGSPRVPRAAATKSESLGRVGTELEDLAIRGSEVLPGFATATHMQLAEQFHVGSPELGNGLLDVVDEEAGNNLVFCELLCRIWAFRSKYLEFASVWELKDSEVGLLDHGVEPSNGTEEAGHLVVAIGLNPRPVHAPNAHYVPLINRLVSRSRSRGANSIHRNRANLALSSPRSGEVLGPHECQG
jgi:hypothetical protein